MQSKILRVMLLFTGSMFMAANCAADVIFTSLGSPLYSAGTLVVGSVAAAEIQATSSQNGFQYIEPTNSYQITSVTVGVFYSPGVPGFTSVAGPEAIFSPNFDIWLYSDQILPGSRVIAPYHAPKDPLAEIAQNLIAPAYPGLVSAAAQTGDIVINGGSFYWIVLTPADPYTLVGWSETDATPKALELDGNLITPEPGSGGFFLLSLCGAGLATFVTRGRKILLPTLLFVGSMFMAANCAADVIFTSLGSPFSFAGSEVLGSAAAAEQFENAPQDAYQFLQPASSYQITSVSVGVNFLPGQPGFSSVAGPSAIFSPNFDIWLYSDQVVPGSRIIPPYHAPKDPLAEIAQNLISPAFPALVSSIANTGITVSGGTLYWIVLTPADPYTLVTWSNTDSGPEALELDGNLITPEPGSGGFFLLSLCGAALATFVTRRRAIKNCIRQTADRTSGV